MRVLVVSATPWNDNNSFGNSYSNIFKGIDGIEFANISFGRILEQTDNEIVKKSFQVSTKMLIKNLLNKNYKVGIEGNVPTDVQEVQNIEHTSTLKFAKKKRWMVLFWLNDLIWKFGRWKSKELIDFIDDFKPDLIFQPIYYVKHMNDIVHFIKKHTNAPMIGYVSDDCYTLKQFSLSPLYWIDRIYKRRSVKKTIEQCEILYVISDIQKLEYEKIFTPPCKILTKCADFSLPCPEPKPFSDSINLIYAGNISKGRGNSLSYICDAVERLNSEGFNVKFDIYSGSPLNKKTMAAFSKTGSQFHGRVSYSEIKLLEKQADILVHAEGLSLKDRLAVHQSFSTKIVDFFEMGKCIFALGSYDEAFANHLINNDAAVVATNKKQVYLKLKQLIEDKNNILLYGKKAYECGKIHHNKHEIQSMVENDIKFTISKSQNVV